MQAKDKLTKQQLRICKKYHIKPHVFVNIGKIGKHMDVDAYMDGKLKAEADTKPLRHFWW